MSKAIYEEIFNHGLTTLLAEIHEGKTVLPDFQRDFVWEPAAISELVSSMVQSFPAGSILRVRNNNSNFAFRHVAEAPRHTTKPVYLILDGQQRLTSLYQAFYGKGSYAFYVDLKALLEGADVDPEIIVSHSRKSRAFKQSSDLQYQAQNFLLPLERLFGSNGGVDKWISEVADKLSKTKEEMSKVLETLRGAKENWVTPITKYTFPVITLSDSTEPAAICTIFETLNRTGIKLTPFELLTARFFPNEKNLRELWSAATVKHPALLRYAVDPYVVLQAITLRVNDAKPTCKRSVLMSLKNEDIDTHWERIIEGLGEALAILRDDCGVLSARWLPYSSMLVPLAATLAKHPLGHSAGAGANRAKLVRWFWCSSLSQRYDSSANRKAEEDYKSVFDWLTGGAPPEYIGAFSFNITLLKSTTPKQRALYAALMCLQQRRDGKLGKQASLDFHTGKMITPELLEDAGIDDHHVFPIGHLGGERSDINAPANGILNRTLIDAVTNRKIGKRAPNNYLSEVKRALAEASVDIAVVLNSHMIEAGENAALWRNDFKGFIAERSAKFEKAIHSATLGQITSESTTDDEAM